MAGIKGCLAATLLCVLMSQAAVVVAADPVDRGVVSVEPGGTVDVGAAPPAGERRSTGSGPVRSPICKSVAGRLLVRYGGRATGSERAAALKAVHGTRLRSYRLVPGLELIHTSVPLGQARGLLASKARVTSVEPDCIVRIDQAPDDPQFAEQWALHNTGQTGGAAGADIGAPAAWDVRTDASTVTVAVIDSGIDLDHPDLAANLWTNPGEVAGNGLDDDQNGYADDVHGWDFVNQDPIPDDDNGHGTHVAGTVGARGDDGIGVVGVAWSVKLMALKAFDASGNGNLSAVIAALDYAVANGARISNNSYGGAEFARSEYDAFVAAGAAGHLAIAAAGNAAVDADELPHYPAAFRLDTVVSVAATTQDDQLASFSNFGIHDVQVAAPGQSILSTMRDGTYGLMSGTSMATPHVAGVAALLAAEHPAWDGKAIRDRILGTTRPLAALVGKAWTGGVVDAGAALSNAPTVLPPPFPPPLTEPLTTEVAVDPAPDPIAAPPPPTFPQPDVLESSPLTVGPPRIALDSTGRPYIAYTRTFDGVHLAALDGASWTDRQLTHAYDDFYWLALAVDGADVPTVALQRSWTSLDAYWDPGVVMLHAGSPATTTERLTASCPDADSCRQDWNPSISFDGAGSAHVAFTRTDPWLQDAVLAPAGSVASGTGNGAYYATNATGDWVIRRLTTGASDGPVVVANEPDGTVHMVVRRRAGPSSGLYYLTDDGGSWSSLQLTDHVEDQFASVGVDGSGGVHVVFARPGLGLYYLHRSPAGAWDAPLLVYDGSAVEPDLAVDPAGHVHVAFGLVDGLNTVAGVRYATNRSGSWVTSTVADGQAHAADLAVDAAGHAHVAFQQATGAPLGIYYATNATGSFKTSLVKASSSQGGPGSVAYAVDAAGHHHVAIASHYGETSAGLFYGTDASGSWVFSRVYAGWPTNVALTLDPGGHAHVAFTEQIDAQHGTILPVDQWQVGYATDAGGPWHVERVSPAGDFSGNGVAIALDPAGQPQIVYLKGDESALIRARRSAGSWTIDTIYAGASSIREPSIQMDPSGVLHVAIVGRLPGDAGFRTIYLQGTTGSWTATSVTSGATMRFYPSLGRASDGTIWVADWEVEHGIWVHQRSPAGVWTSTHLSSSAYDAFPSVGIDAGNTAHVTFSGGAFYNTSGCTVPECAAGPGVRYATFAGGSWQTTRLSPYWQDTSSVLARGGDGSLSLLVDRLNAGLRSYELMPGSLGATLDLQAGSDSGSSSTDDVTSSMTLTFDLDFNRPVTGLAATDLAVSGTATGCTVNAPAGSGAAYTVAVTGCSSGTMTLTLAAGSVDDDHGDPGPGTAVAAPPVLIDRTAPAATAPVASLRMAVSLSGSAIPARVAWTGSDAGGAGVARYEIARANGSAVWVTLSTSLTSPTADSNLPSTGTIRFRVRAVDRAGNAGPWVYGATMSPRLVQQSSTSVHYGGTWSLGSSSSYSGGSVRFASSAGRSATYTFTGRSIAIVTTRSPTRGKVKVYIGGVYVATVDLSGTTSYRRLAWQRTWSTYGTRTIKLVVVGTAGHPRVDLDAFAVLR